MAPRRSKKSDESDGLDLPPVPARTRFKTMDGFYFSPTDQARLHQALVEAFPTARVLRQEYWEHWIDRVFGPSEDGPNWREILSETMRAPHRDPMPYISNLGDVEHDWYKIWVEPPGWKPQWSRRAYRRGRYVLLNEPPRQFELYTSCYWLYGPAMEHRDTLDKPPATLADDEICSIESGRLLMRYLDDDLEQRQFIKAVWRILQKLWTDRLALVDPDTLRSGAVIKPHWTRAGLDVVDWTRRDRRHLIQFPGMRAADAFRDARGPMAVLRRYTRHRKNSKVLAAYSRRFDQMMKEKGKTALREREAAVPPKSK